eukprot:6424308-Amphidinium_carterae.1
MMGSNYPARRIHSRTLLRGVSMPPICTEDRADLVDGRTGSALTCEPQNATAPPKPQLIKSGSKMGLVHKLRMGQKVGFRGKLVP